MKKAFQCALEWGAAKNCPIIKMLKTPPQKYDFLTTAECRKLTGCIRRRLARHDRDCPSELASASESLSP